MRVRSSLLLVLLWLGAACGNNGARDASEGGTNTPPSSAPSTPSGQSENTADDVDGTEPGSEVSTIDADDGASGAGAQTPDTSGDDPGAPDSTDDMEDGNGSDPTPGSDTGDSLGSITGEITLLASGYAGSSTGDLYVAVMDGNPVDCVLGAGPEPVLVGSQTIANVDLTGGAAVEYNVEGVAPGNYYISAFLDENGNAPDNGRPDLGELSAVVLAELTPPMITVEAGEPAMIDLVLNFAPPPIGPASCSPIL